MTQILEHDPEGKNDLRGKCCVFQEGQKLCILSRIDYFDSISIGEFQNRKDISVNELQLIMVSTLSNVYTFFIIIGVVQLKMLYMKERYFLSKLFK